jgi:predicted dinucleotide-binding enzyme
LGGRRSSDIVANLVPDAKRVKAFNTLLAAALAADPKQGGGQRVNFDGAKAQQP